MPTPGRVLFAVSLLLCAAFARGAPVVLDDCDSPEAWKVIASDGVSAKLSAAAGQGGQALRLDFDFQSGAGFCVLRRDLKLPLPPNYRFTFGVRGEGPPNNLEFKLVDPSGLNVWWINRRSFQFPHDWQTISQKARHFRFAWGPSGGQPLTELGAIEFAIAAASGGQGYILLDELTFEPLPVPQPPTRAPVVHYSSTDGDAPVERALTDAGQLDWTSAADDAQPTLRVDFHQPREFGGLAIDWAAEDYATDYDVSLSDDGERWEPAAGVEGSTGGRDYVPIPDAEARFVRVAVAGTSRGRGVSAVALRVLPPDFASTPNAMFRAIAREAPRGRFPRYLLDEQPYWTVVGVPADDKEALLDTDGAIEVDKQSWRLEPFLQIDDRLMTWADVATRPSLAEGYLPIPSVTWDAGDVKLTITALAHGTAGAATLSAAYRVCNRGEAEHHGALILALRPFQVLPPWQELNVTGGVAGVETIARNGDRIIVNGAQELRLWTPPTGFATATFAQGGIVEHLAAMRTTPFPPGAGARGESSAGIQDATGWASAALRYAFTLPPGEARTVVVSVPFHAAGASWSAPTDESAAAARFAELAAEVADAWRAELNRVQLTLPPDAAWLFDTLRTTLAYILINADGPAIQPGSRTYERSWIRDGALTSTALLHTGHADRVRVFLDWYCGHLFPNGKVPCIVDRRGPDPVPEHDSTGQLIFALLKYYEFTGDRAFLEAHLPQVAAGVDYLESLRRPRLTDEYRDGPPEKRACYGLVTESISHEGYCDQPRHSYWDSFFVMRGLKDATTIARLLGRAELEPRFATLRDEYRTTLYDSVRLAIRTKNIDYVPGCAELGDFDATSTGIAVFPCGEGDNLPQPAGARTFERYLEFFRDRRDGRLKWEGYTPYEIRLVSTFVHLGQPEHARELLDFFRHDRRPTAWNQWAEVVWREPATPKYIGDMPHTWVGSEFVNGVRNLFLHERERDGALVLAAGVSADWLAASTGLVVADWPTEYGRLSYTLRADGEQTRLDVALDGEVPPGGIIVRSPRPEPIRAADASVGTVRCFDAHEVVLGSRRACVSLTHAR